MALCTLYCRSKFILFLLLLLLLLFLLLPGILRLFQGQLLASQTIEDCGHTLGKLPDDLDSDTLFLNIAAVSLSSKQFTRTLSRYLPPPG